MNTKKTGINRRKSLTLTAAGVGYHSATLQAPCSHSLPNIPQARYFFGDDCGTFVAEPIVEAGLHAHPRHSIGIRYAAHDGIDHRHGRASEKDVYSDERWFYRFRSNRAPLHCNHFKLGTVRSAATRNDGVR
jgi:hypothetical protein